jgi:hypothetical protein
LQNFQLGWSDFFNVCGVELHDFGIVRQKELRGEAAGMRGRLGQTSSSPLAEPCAPHRSQFRVGGLSVQISSDCSFDVALSPALERFRIEADASDIHIRAERVEDLLPLAASDRLFDSGSVWRLYQDGSGLQFDFSTPVLGKNPYKRLSVDREFQSASLLLSHESLRHSPAALPLEYPLDELLITHRLTQRKGIELHGCGVASPEGNSNLFVGHSGAGKSTTARLWNSLPGVKILSDDRIIVRRHTGQVVMYGTPWHGEGAFASPESAVLGRIFILEHGKGNVLTRLSRSQAVGELFARSFVPPYRKDYVDSALAFLQDVADSVSCYRYGFEPDRKAVERILEFRD